METIISMVDIITPQHDSKLKNLQELIKDKIKHPINAGNKKIIIFTAFADTAMYLFDNISWHIKNKFGLHTAVITGSIDGKTTVQRLKSDLNTVLTLFSPISKDKKALMPNDNTMSFTNNMFFRVN